MATVRTSNTISLPLASRLTTAVASLLLGVFIIYGVGLSHSETLHDTATRHPPFIWISLPLSSLDS